MGGRGGGEEEEVLGAMRSKGNSIIMKESHRSGDYLGMSFFKVASNQS